MANKLFWSYAHFTELTIHQKMHPFKNETFILFYILSIVNLVPNIHQHLKRIDQNAHLQTLYATHSYVLSIVKCFSMNIHQNWEHINHKA